MAGAPRRPGRHHVHVSDATPPPPDDVVSYYETDVEARHLPEELEAEICGVGFEVVGVYGVEGPGWLHRNLGAAWEDERMRGRLLVVAQEAEAHPHLRALSPHLLAVARRRRGSTSSP